MRAILIVMILIISVSGCTIKSDQVISEGLAINVEADPQRVFSDSTTRLYVDVENIDTKTVNDLDVDVYYTGRLTELDEENCKKHEDELEPGEIVIMEKCDLTAPSKDEMTVSSVKTDVAVKVDFTTKLNVAQLIEMITKEAYDIKVRAGSLETKPKSYVYRDKNIEMQVDFSDRLPIVVREGKTSFVYFTIKNIGNGFISDIEDRDFVIKQQEVNGNKIVDCDFTVISPREREFPRIACELNLPDDVTYLSNHVIIIELEYDYEIRKEVPVEIVR